MPRGQSVEIAGQNFQKKGDALAFIKEMLNRYRPGDTVAMDDQKFLIAALARHPEAASKIGSGAQRFEVRSADYGTQCFWIIRTDGSEERFSYKSCV